MTLKKTPPTTRCYVPGFKQCWVCGIPKEEKLFQFDDEACNECYVEDLKEELEALKAKKKPGRPKKQVDDTDKESE